MHILLFCYLLHSASGFMRPTPATQEGFLRTSAKDLGILPPPSTNYPTILVHSRPEVLFKSPPLVPKININQGPHASSGIFKHNRYRILTRRPFLTVEENSASFDPYHQPFRYNTELGVMYRRTTDEGCIICFANDDCIAMNHYRCEYSAAMSGLIEDDSVEEESTELQVPVPEIRREVDSMMFSLMEKVNDNAAQYKDCVPHVSKYTDCTKENVCIGCKSCDCGSDGRWACVITQKCRPVTRTGCDHRTLITVIENMRNGNDPSWNRVKRSAQTTTPFRKANNVTNNIDQLAKLVYGVSRAVQALASNLTYGPKSETTEAAGSNIIPDTDDTKMDVPDNTLAEISKNLKKINDTDTKISFAEISEWISQFHLTTAATPHDTPSTANVVEYGIDSLLTDIEHNDVKTNKAKKQNIINPEPTAPPIESHNFVFDEVLDAMHSGPTNYSKKKCPANERYMETNVFANDEVDTNLNNFEFNDRSYVAPIAVEFNEVTTVADIRGKKEPRPRKADIATTQVTMTAKNTENVINLLTSTQKDLNYRSDGKSIVFTDLYEGEKDYKPKLIISNDLNLYSGSNVMKRDVSFVLTHNNVTNTSATTTIPPTTLATIANATEEVDGLKNLKNNVLFPLITLLEEKHKEIDELYKMKNNLVSFLNNYKHIPELEFNEIISNRTNNITDKEIIERDKKIFSSITQYLPQIRTTIKGGNSTSIVSKYMLKLKRDIYEVIRDIVGIRKLSDPTKLPEDLKFLMRALKHYVHKQGTHASKAKITNAPIKLQNTRRQLEPRGPIFNSDPIKEDLIKILEAIDRNMPTSDALKPLSPETKKILKRVVKRYYIDDFAGSGLRVYDPQYNLTNDLRNIGTKWSAMTTAIAASAPSDKLYAMKLLHHELAQDINKMKDALALINFAHSRRMIPVEENVGEAIMNKINNDLNEMHGKLSTLLREEPVTPLEEENSQVWSTPQRKPKVSFMTQIKNLLRTSKNDILSLLRKKIPKSEIFKELARKQLDAVTRRKLSDYEQTMQKWQDNLGIVKVRNKRTLVDFDTVRNRIKNIIPKYLRGKVRSLTAEKDARKSKNKAENSKKKKSSTIYPETTLKSTITAVKTHSTTASVRNTADKSSGTTVLTTLKPMTTKLA